MHISRRESPGVWARTLSKNVGVRLGSRVSSRPPLLPIKWHLRNELKQEPVSPDAQTEPCVQADWKESASVVKPAPMLLFLRNSDGRSWNISGLSGIPVSQAALRAGPCRTSIHDDGFCLAKFSPGNLISIVTFVTNSLGKMYYLEKSAFSGQQPGRVFVCLRRESGVLAAHDPPASLLNRELFGNRIGQRLPECRAIAAVPDERRFCRGPARQDRNGPICRQISPKQVGSIFGDESVGLKSVAYGYRLIPAPIPVFLQT